MSKKLATPTEQQLFSRLLASPQAGQDLDYFQAVSLGLCQATETDIAEAQFTDLIDRLCDPDIARPDIIYQLGETIDEYKSLLTALEGVQGDYHALCVAELGAKALDG